MSESVDVVFTYTREEYTRAMKRHYQSVLSIRRDVIAGSIAVAGGCYWLRTSDDRWLGWLLLIPGMVMLATIASALFILPGLIYYYQPRLKNEYRLSFSDDGIKYKTKGIDASLDWSLYRSWLRDDEFYFMYHGKHDLSVIPRRSLSTAAADERFEVLLTRKIGAPSALQSATSMLLKPRDPP